MPLVQAMAVWGIGTYEYGVRKDGIPNIDFFPAEIRESFQKLQNQKDLPLIERCENCTNKLPATYPRGQV
jgi:hypothetical protein